MECITNQTCEGSDSVCAPVVSCSPSVGAFGADITNANAGTPSGKDVTTNGNSGAVARSKARTASGAGSSPMCAVSPMHTTPSALPHASCPIVISVEAAIGTGKSTLLKILKRCKPDWVVVPEPVEMWQNVGPEGSNLLDAFYKDPARYAFSFQTYCVLTRIEVVTKALKACAGKRTPVVILERSWFSDRHTFGEMLHASGNMSAMEWALYTEWYAFAVRNAPDIHGHIYLECDPATCMSRLRKRSRSEEVGVTDTYQQNLIAQHERWLETVPHAKVQRVNVVGDFADDQEAMRRVVNTVQLFADRLAHVRSASSGQPMVWE